MDITSVIPHRAVFGHNSRYYVMAVAVLALSAIVSNSYSFNFTVICMKRDVEVNVSSAATAAAETPAGNGTSEEQELRFNAGEISWLFSAFAIGGLLGIGPVSPLITRYGLRAVLTGCGLLSAVSTLILPFAVTHLSYTLLFLVRVLQGLALAPCMPSISHVTQHWATKTEAAMFLGILSSYLQIGTFIAMPVSGWLCQSSWNWPAAFYIAGIWTLLMFSLFYLLYQDHPEESWFITNAELITLGYLRQPQRARGDTVRALGATVPVKDEGAPPTSAIVGDSPPVMTTPSTTAAPTSPAANVNESVPYRTVLTDPAVWGSLAHCLAFACAYLPIAIFGPILINRALHYSVSSSGMLDSVPFLVTVLGKFLIISPLVQERGWIKNQPKMFIVWFPAFVQFLNAGWYLLLALLPIISPTGGLEWLAVVVMVLLLGGNGAGFVGLAKNIQIIAQHSSHFVMAIVYLLNCLVILTMPPLVAWMAPDQSAKEFSPIFFGVAACLVLLTIIFLLLAQTEPRPWTKIKTANNNVAFITAETGLPSVEKVTIRSTPEKRVQPELTSIEKY